MVKLFGKDGTTSPPRESQVAPEVPDQSPSETPAAQEEGDSPEYSQPDPETIEAVEENVSETGSPSEESDELQRLRSVSMMQEKLIEIREEQLEELRSEKTWLKSRIEKLEEQAKRDQVLLMTEADTLRRVLAQQRRSPVRSLLEWCGVVQPQSQQLAIDINAVEKESSS